MDTKQVVKDTGNNLLKFGSAAAGLAVGSFGMKKVPNISALPPIANKILPGLAGMVIAAVVGTKATNANVKAGALGLGLAGFIDVVNKTVGDKIPAAFKLPALSGYDGGEYDPSYYARSVNGPGDAYALSGDGSAYQLAGNLLTM